jgi:hypothetical protein
LELDTVQISARVRPNQVSKMKELVFLNYGKGGMNQSSIIRDALDLYFSTRI